MKGRLFLVILLIIIFMIAGYFLAKFFSEENEEIVEEYIPQEEISEEQERMTLITLYFIDKETRTITPEARLIDAKLLIENPCMVLVELLLNGPKSDKLEAVIPNGTKIDNVVTENRTVTVEFNIDEIDEEQANNIRSSVTSTLVELSEIDSVNILINKF